MAGQKIHEHHELAAQHYEHAARQLVRRPRITRPAITRRPRTMPRIAFGDYLEPAEQQNNAAGQYGNMHAGYSFSATLTRS